MVRDEGRIKKKYEVAVLAEGDRDDAIPIGSSTFGGRCRRTASATCLPAFSRRTRIKRQHCDQADWPGRFFIS